MSGENWVGVSAFVMVFFSAWAWIIVDSRRERGSLKAKLWGYDAARKEMDRKQADGGAYNTECVSYVNISSEKLAEGLVTGHKLAVGRAYEEMRSLYIEAERGLLLQARRAAPEPSRRRRPRWLGISADPNARGGAWLAGHRRAVR